MVELLEQYRINYYLKEVVQDITMQIQELHKNVHLLIRAPQYSFIEFISLLQRFGIDLTRYCDSGEHIDNIDP